MLRYLFPEANSFPRVKLKENCELQGKIMSKDNFLSIFSKSNGPRKTEFATSGTLLWMTVFSSAAGIFSLLQMVGKERKGN